MAQFDANVSAKFFVGGIIAKVPLSWRSFATSLKHKRGEDMMVDDLIAHLDVEEKARAKDASNGALEGTSNANLVQKPNTKSKGKNVYQNSKPKNTTNFKKKKNMNEITCFVCGELDHKANRCKHKKQGGRKNVQHGQNNANMVVSEPGTSGLPVVPPS